MFFQSLSNESNFYIPCLYFKLPIGTVNKEKLSCFVCLTKWWNDLWSRTVSSPLPPPSSALPSAGSARARSSRPRWCASPRCGRSWCPRWRTRRCRQSTRSPHRAGCHGRGNSPAHRLGVGVEVEQSLPGVTPPWSLPDPPGLPWPLGKEWKIFLMHFLL